MNNRNPIDSLTLLDCISTSPAMISAEGISDLRSTLRDKGYIGGGNIAIHTDLEDVQSAAQQLINNGYATMDRKGWLTITEAGMTKNDAH